MSAEEKATRPTTVRRGRRHRWVLWSVVGVLVLVIGVVGTFAYQAITARNALASALGEVQSAEAAVGNGDVATAQDSLERIQPLTEKARRTTDGLLWRAAARLPVVGADIRAFVTSATVSDAIAQDVLPPLAHVASIADGENLTVRDGTIDLAPLATAAPLVASAAQAMDSVLAQLAEVDTDALHSSVAKPFGRLVTKAESLDETVRTAERVTSLAPTMLGADGPRTYLVVAMNNAELRAPGGIPGAFAVMTADNGKISLGSQFSTLDIGPFPTPVATLDEADMKLYSDRLGRYVQDTALTPDFPTTATLAATMWKKAGGQAVDGVVATDPVALSYLLKATGPLSVDGVRLTADTAVKELLSMSYARLKDGPATDAFFSAVTARVVGVALSGSADPVEARHAVTQAAKEHRLLIWSAHPEEQQLLTDTVVSGSIDESPRAGRSVGVFFNDATGGKMGYYLASDVRLTASYCTDGGRQDTYAVDLASTAPTDAAAVLSPYVTGDGVAGVPPGTLRTLVTLYPPRDGRILDPRVDNTPVSGMIADVADRRAIAVKQDLVPGQRAVLTFATLTPRGSGAPDESVDVWSTPTTSSTGLRTFPIATCP